MTLDFHFSSSAVSSSDGIGLVSANFLIDDPIHFGYRLDEDRLWIGGGSDVNLLRGLENDFQMRIDGIRAGAPTLAYFNISQGDGNIAIGTPTLVFSPPESVEREVVPIPASLTLLVGAVGLLGLRRIGRTAA